ncbi:MAG: YebC/PmpR family DNA-binding transcriptional regulator [Patescibacteria group bacterium]|nr:YebC/PmpR family DNA-binding transcriptional regulator [Patescibacteria group bacterium]
MSGHSHAKTILHKKQISDAKRGKIFSKLSRLISITARQGANPETNSKLRQVLEEAKKFHLPKENIERAIKKGSGELGDEARLEEFIFEAYGPGGIALIIEGITDNKNRALGEIKQILSQNKGKFAGSGSVKWLFERKGCVTIDNEQETIDKEEMEMKAIEAGAEDIDWQNNIINIYVFPENLEKTKENLEKQKIDIDYSSLDWVAKEKIEIKEDDKQACEKLFDILDDNEAVQGVYSNLKT